MHFLWPLGSDLKQWPFLSIVDYCISQKLSVFNASVDVQCLTMAFKPVRCWPCTDFVVLMLQIIMHCCLFGETCCFDRFSARFLTLNYTFLFMYIYHSGIALLTRISISILFNCKQHKRQSLCSYSLLVSFLTVDQWPTLGRVVVVLCDLMQFVGVSETTLSLACSKLNVSALQKQSHLYARLTYAVAQVRNNVCLCTLYNSWSINTFTHCCCPWGKSLSSRILKDQFTSPCHSAYSPLCMVTWSP